MKQVTRNIDPSSAHDLLRRVPRACVAFTHNDRSLAQPVTVIWRDNRYFTGIHETASHLPSEGQEVVLLIDEGIYFFNLRAIYIRGHIQTAAPPTDTATRHSWFEVIPSKIVAWDYGTLHEVENEC